jgi:release factor glutamine methyltransferase
MSGSTRVTKHQPGNPDPLVRRLRRAGCVFAEEEATILRQSASDAAELETLCARRVAGEPLEHLVGWVAFGELRLAVGPGVFVPRQRSRLLASATITAAMTVEAPVVLEAFCGVAPIAASVRRALPHAAVHATDIDDIALDFARQNLDDAAGVYCGDGFTGLGDLLRQRINVIAAVPPYVPSTAAGFLPREALEYEPRRALFAGPSGLDCIRELISQASEWLTDDGLLLVEMNKDQCPQALRYVKRVGYDVSEYRGGDGQTTVLRLRSRARRLSNDTPHA